MGGKATNPIGSATGGAGASGGNIRIASRSGTITVENHNTLSTGDGGKGGDAFSEGDPANATGGPGGDGGILEMTPTAGGVGSGTLLNVRGVSGNGGTARALGEFGDDATTSAAATKGGNLSAVGGPAGIVHQPNIDPTPNAQGFTLTFSEPRAGNGGDALGSGGDGGKGSKEFPSAPWVQTCLCAGEPEERYCPCPLVPDRRGRRGMVASHGSWAGTAEWAGSPAWTTSCLSGAETGDREERSLAGTVTGAWAGRTQNSRVRLEISSWRTPGMGETGETEHRRSR